MSCVVYCLVPRPEDLDPLVGRIEDAGVPARDIMVVHRPPGELRPGPDPEPDPDPEPEPEDPPAIGGGDFVPTLLSLALAPAAWMWQLTVTVGADPGRPARDEAAGHEADDARTVIRLSAYKPRCKGGAH